MPHISINLYPGRSKDDLEKFAGELQKALAKSGGWKATDISVSVGEIEADNFEKEVGRKIKDEDMVIPSDFIK